MITEHNRFNIPTISGKPIEFEVNWSDAEDVKDSKILKLFINGGEVLVLRDNLTAVIMLLGDADTKRKLLPMERTTIRQAKRLLDLEFVATRAYKKGEKIHAQAWHTDVMEDNEEIYYDAMKNANKNRTASGLIIK